MKNIKKSPTPTAPAPNSSNREHDPMLSMLIHSNDLMARFMGPVVAKPRMLDGQPPHKRTNVDRLSLGGRGEPKLKLWTWTTHASKATAAAYVPETNEVFVATDDGQVSVRNGLNYSVTRKYQWHLYEITALIPVSTRKSIITSSADGTIKEWSSGNGQPKGTLKTLSMVPVGLSITTDENLVAIGDAGGGLYLHSFSKGTIIMEKQKAFATAILAVAMHPTGQAMAAVGIDDPKIGGILRVWSVQGTQLMELKGQKEGLTAVGFDPSGKWLIAGSQSGNIEWWDFANYGFQGSVPAHSQEISKIRFLPSGKMVTASVDGAMTIRKAGSWDRLLFLTAYYGYIQDIAFTSNEKDMLECGPEVRLWDAGLGYLKLTLDSFQGLVNSIVISNDGKRVFTLSMDGILKSWNIDPFSLEKTVKTLDGARALASSPDGNLLAIGDDSGSIAILSANELARVRDIQSDGDSVTDLTFVGDQSKIIAGYRSGAIRLWGSATGKLVSEWYENNAPVTGISLGNDEKLAASFLDGTISIFELVSGKETKVYSCPFGIYSVKFSTKGQYLFLGQYDGDLVVLSPTDGFKEVSRKRFDTYPILRIDVDVNDSMVATVDLFGTVRKIDQSDLNVVVETKDNYIEKYAVAVHPKLNLIVTGGSRRRIEFWTWR